MLKFKPARDRILVEALQPASRVGKVHVPEAFKEARPAEAVVVAIGCACTLPVKVGDRVVTERYNGTEVRIGEKPYRLLDPVDVLAIVGGDLEETAA